MNTAATTPQLTTAMITQTLTHRPRHMETNTQAAIKPSKYVYCTSDTGFSLLSQRMFKIVDDDLIVSPTFPLCVLCI